MAFDSSVIQEIKEVAEEKGIEPAALLAITEVESGGKAFTTINGKDMPLILYEYHIFYRWHDLTDSQRKEAVSRNLASQKWGTLPYKRTQSARYDQLARAAKINEQAAYAACSWGVGQVLGQNAEWLGYGTPKALAEAAISGLKGQVEVMMAFVEKRKLLDELAAHDWRGFARQYNGPGNVDSYAPKLQRAYERHAGQKSKSLGPPTLRVGSRGDAVAHLQRALRGLGFSLHVDGDFGPATRRQVQQFQAEQGLAVDGIAGAKTLARIEALSTTPINL